MRTALAVLAAVVVAVPACADEDGSAVFVVVERPPGPPEPAPLTIDELDAVARRIARDATS